MTIASEAASETASKTTLTTALTRASKVTSAVAALPPVICLMGPTASGKTPLAIEIVQHFPCEIISVDSAMVYRGMNIGSAKPDADVLRIAPHRLIDILDPSDIYSAGQFRKDALREIDDVFARGKIPLLVGGTMMYFRVLQQGLAQLPKADLNLRADLQQRAQQQGWEAMHAFLASVDAAAAQRINPNDSQRIQRALEVYLLTGKTITSWQENDTSPLSGYRVYNIALAMNDRALLHQRIENRFDAMLKAGFIEEVESLYARGDLSSDLPSIRSVGYRQAWDYLSGIGSHTDMREKAIIATRQLAKRQMTWLRSWLQVQWLEANSKTVFDEMKELLKSILG
jgi:tRNA dimethylallyltransferase